MWTFTFNLGPIMPDGTLGKPQSYFKSDESPLEVLHRFRTLVADSGYVNDKCSQTELDVARPISMASELLVMSLFKSLLAAHLDETAWVSGNGKPPPPADTAPESRVELARKALAIERGVFQWYVASIIFAEEYLRSPSAEVLQKRLCSAFLQKAKKSKPKDISKYSWLVDHVLAPLAFLQKAENGEPCSVKQTKYTLKAKVCKEILQPKEGGHGEEL